MQQLVNNVSDGDLSLIKITSLLTVVWYVNSNGTGCPYLANVHCRRASTMSPPYPGMAPILSLLDEIELQQCCHVNRRSSVGYKVGQTNYLEHFTTSDVPCAQCQL